MALKSTKITQKLETVKTALFYQEYCLDMMLPDLPWLMFNNLFMDLFPVDQITAVLFSLDFPQKIISRLQLIHNSAVRLLKKMNKGMNE